MATVSTSAVDAMRLRWVRLLLVTVVLVASHVPDGASAATGRIVAAETVNIRACASIDCPVIGTAALGDTIEITGEPTKGFYPVTWYGAEGFVSTLYISRDGQAPWLEETDVSCHQVAIIFNIGIGDPPSQRILDTLIARDAAATMFPMGWWAEAEPDYLRARRGRLPDRHARRPDAVPDRPQ